MLTIVKILPEYRNSIRHVTKIHKPTLAGRPIVSRNGGPIQNAFQASLTRSYNLLLRNKSNRLLEEKNGSVEIDLSSNDARSCLSLVFV